MAKLKSVCVYCGSSLGVNTTYRQAALTLGKAMADAGLKLIYGGGSVGLMGTVAQAVLDNGGHVTGIIPTFLQRSEAMLDSVSHLIVTEDMHERKRKMFERADAFVALPGGIGTLEEVVEMMTWAQLGRHRKPVLLANIENFWQPLFELINHMQQEQFIHSGRAVPYLVANEAENIVPMLEKAVSDEAPDSLDVDMRKAPFNKL